MSVYHDVNPITTLRKHPYQAVMFTLGASLAFLYWADPAWTSNQSIRPYVVSGFVSWTISVAAQTAEATLRFGESKALQRRGLCELIELLVDIRSRHSRLTSGMDKRSTDDQIALAVKTFETLGVLLKKLRREEFTLPPTVDVRAIAKLTSAALLSVELDKPETDRSAGCEDQARRYHEALSAWIQDLEDLRDTLRG